MGLDRTILWRPLTGSGLEHVRISQEGDQIRIRGITIGEADDQAYGLFYEVVLDTGWTFQSIMIGTDTGATEVLSRTESGQWQDRDGDRPDFAGCVDIDLSGSPFTNTLPIRRVTDWAIGAPRRFEMVYIEVPSLRLSRNAQIYTRLAADRFRYEAADGSFAAEIEVDEEGFVRDYPPLFTRA